MHFPFRATFVAFFCAGVATLAIAESPMTTHTPATAAMRTFMQTNTSANLMAALTDETGTGGGVVFATAPTVTTLTIGSGGLAMSTGNISGLGNVTANGANAYQLLNSGLSATVPNILTDRADTTTGFNSNAAGAIDFIAGGANQARITAGHFYVIAAATVGVTETGYLCYNGASSPVNELLRDTVACLASLEELKNKVADIQPDEALSEVMQLKPFWYTWNQRKHPTTDTSVQPGLGARATERVDPRLVAYNSKGQLHTVRYEQMVAVLVAAMQAQQREINELKKELRK